jgi:hypothetical protein
MKEGKTDKRKKEGMALRAQIQYVICYSTYMKHMKLLGVSRNNSWPVFVRVGAGMINY